MTGSLGALVVLVVLLVLSLTGWWAGRDSRASRGWTDSTFREFPPTSRHRP